MLGKEQAGGERWGEGAELVLAESSWFVCDLSSSVSESPWPNPSVLLL